MDIELIILYLTQTWIFWAYIFLYILSFILISEYVYSRLIGNPYTMHSFLFSIKHTMVGFCLIFVYLSLLIFIENNIISFDFLHTLNFSKEIKISDFLQIIAIGVIVVTYIKTLEKSNQNIQESRFSRIQLIEMKNSSKIGNIDIRASRDKFSLHLPYYEKMYDFKITFYDEAKKKVNTSIKVDKYIINSRTTKIDEIEFKSYIGKKKVKSNRLDIEVGCNINKTKYVAIQYLSEHLNEFLDLYELKVDFSKPWDDYSYKLIYRDFPWCKDGWASNYYESIKIYEDWLSMIPNTYFKDRIREKVCKLKEEIKKIFSKPLILINISFKSKSDANGIHRSFEIEIHNIGKRKIIIDAIGLDIEDNTELLNKKPSYPIILQEGQKYSAVWEIEELKKELGKKMPKYAFIKSKDKKTQIEINEQIIKSVSEE